MTSELANYLHVCPHSTVGLVAPTTAAGESLRTAAICDTVAHIVCLARDS